MKIKKDRSHVIVEMGRKESGLPPAGVAELRLRHILVPVDFSECSHKALQYAVSFARQFGAELMLLHVVVAVPPPPQMLVFEAETLRGKYHEEAAKHLSDWRKEVASQISVKAVVREGMAAHQEIVAAAHECNSDLIVIGNHGRGGLARVLTGSTAERVVRHAPCPVLVVRGREHEFLVNAVESAKEKSVAV
ncbi:MAG TPA: universal stress protein [Verrucomicrobiae bacterium]|jgi:nucleotide-binding universal stress UspA family protein